MNRNAIGSNLINIHSYQLLFLPLIVPPPPPHFPKTTFSIQKVSVVLGRPYPFPFQICPISILRQIPFESQNNIFQRTLSNFFYKDIDRRIFLAFYTTLYIHTYIHTYIQHTCIHTYIHRVVNTTTMPASDGFMFTTLFLNFNTSMELFWTQKTRF